MEKVIHSLTVPVPRPRLLRVAAYARVSSGKDAMLHSLSRQISYYSQMIQKHPGWTYAGCYADADYTGTRGERPEFQRLLADCRAGKIDRILTKSVSRFARNTVTLLETARELKERGIAVFFEKERLDTLSGDGELMLSFLASFAQEESRSVSENCKWRVRKDFSEGRPMNLMLLYGYRSEKGRIVVDPEEAAVVRRIFHDYTHGLGSSLIAEALRKERIPCRLGGRWSSSLIRTMLTNEKYMGDALLQKTFCADHLTKKKVVNRGSCHSIMCRIPTRPSLTGRPMPWPGKRCRQTGKRPTCRSLPPPGIPFPVGSSAAAADSITGAGPTYPASPGSAGLICKGARPSARPSRFPRRLCIESQRKRWG